MATTNTSNKSRGLSLGTILFLIFLVLKLTGNIDWSWWWVTCPLWIGIALFLGVTAIVGFFALLGKIFGRRSYNYNRWRK